MMIGANYQAPPHQRARSLQPTYHNDPSTYHAAMRHEQSPHSHHPRHFEQLPIMRSSMTQDFTTPNNFGHAFVQAGLGLNFDPQTFLGPAIALPTPPSPAVFVSPQDLHQEIAHSQSSGETSSDSSFGSPHGGSQSFSFNGAETVDPYQYQRHMTAPPQVHAFQYAESYGSPTNRGDPNPVIKQEAATPEVVPDQADPSSTTKPKRRSTSMSEAKVLCHICGKPFARIFNYNTHMQTHNPSRVPQFPCVLGDCDKRFHRHTDLTRHQRSVHYKSKDFKCGWCGKGFPRNDSLVRHRRDGSGCIRHRTRPSPRASKRSAPKAHQSPKARL